MTTTQQAHSVFGGCVAIRTRGNQVGVWSPQDAMVWSQTASATHEELAAKLAGMVPRRVAAAKDKSWVEAPHMRHPTETERGGSRRKSGGVSRTLLPRDGW